MNPEDLLIGEGNDVMRVVRSVLGIQREAFVCPECGEACKETYRHDRQRMAFDGGVSPAWTCPECGSDYVREVSDDMHAIDLYGRDPPE